MTCELALHVERPAALALRCACGWQHEWVAPVPFGWVGYEATRHSREVREAARRPSPPCSCMTTGKVGCPSHHGCYSDACAGTWPHEPGTPGRAFHVRSCERADLPTNESLDAAPHAQPSLSVTATNDASTASPIATDTPSPLSESVNP